MDLSVLDPANPHGRLVGDGPTNFVNATAPNFGVNIDFGTVPVYANLVRCCLWWNPLNNPYASANVAVDQFNCPTTDFSLYINPIETKSGPNGDLYPIRFVGRATIQALGGCSISGAAYDAQANVTSAMMAVAPNTAIVLLGFANTRRLPTDTTSTGLDCRTLTIMRPIAPGASQWHAPSEKWNRQLIPALAPWKGGYWRDLDTGIINNVENLPVQTPANRTMPYSPIQTILTPTRGVCWEDRIELANFLGMGLWTNFPDTGTADLFQLYLNIAKFGSDATGTPYTAAGGSNPVPASGPVHAPLAGKLLWEEGNENWNTFAQNTRLAQAGLANYDSLNANGEINPHDGSAPLDPLFCQVASLLLAHADQAKATFPGGLGTKYFPVFCSQSGNTPTRDHGMMWLKRRLATRNETIPQNIACVGGDGYENPVVNVGDSSQTVNSVIAGGVSSNPGIAADGVAATNYGIAFASYECGPTIVDNPLGIATKHDPRYRAQVCDRALNMVACRCQYITVYTLIHGEWSILDSIQDLTHPKWLGWSDAIAYYPMDGRTPVPLPTSSPPAFADPSFEQVRIDAVAAGFVYQPGGAWTYTAASGVNGPTTGFINAGQPILHGTQVGFLQGTGSMAQSIAGWAAGSYQITGRMNARLNNGTLPFDVLVDGTVVGTFTPTATTNFSTFQTTPFTVTGGSHTVMLRTTSNQDLTVLLDDLAIVRVVPVTPVTPAAIKLNNGNAAGLFASIGRLAY